MSRKRQPEESGFDIGFFSLMAETATAEELSDTSGHKVTWLDLAIDYALSLEATIRGKEPGALRITPKQTAEALRKYCGESVAEQIPGTEEIASALRERKYLRRLYSITQ